MRSLQIVLGLMAIMVICAALPLEDPRPLSTIAEELLAVDSPTVHENESERKARQFYYNPYGSLYGYGGSLGGYGGLYGGYGGYGLYGYRRSPYYGYGNYPYYGGFPYIG